MRLSKLFSYFYIIKFILVLVLGVLAFVTLGNYIEQIDSEKQRMQSYIIAKEIEENTNSLTKFARMYVATGDTAWENDYYELLEVIRGQRPRPDGTMISTMDSLKKLNATKEEYAKIEEARVKYKDVFDIEEKAFNAMLGRFADENGKYTITGAPDRQLAYSLMFGKEYQKAKERIMEPIIEFEDMIEKRTNDNYNHNNAVRDRIIWSKIVVILIVLSIMTMGFVIMRVRLLKRNDELEIAYEDLEDSEDRYKALFENSPDGYLTIVDGKFDTYNKSAQRMMLCDNEYITGKSPDEISPEYQPDGRASVEVRNEKIERALMYGPQTFEWVHKRCDGSELMVEVCLNAIILNGKQAFLATWRDITERKKIEQELKESTKNLKISQEIAKIGSWEMDLIEGEFTLSPEANKIFGINSSKEYAMPGEIAFSIPLPEYRDLVNNAIQNLVKKNEEYNIEFQAKRFDNDEVVWIHAKAEMEQNSEGKPYKILGIVQDVSKQKKIENALRESESELLEINAAKDKFFSIISHDLKGPYNALLNLSEILVEEYDDLTEEETKQFIHSIDDIASNSYKLLENLLEWSRLQTGGIKYNPENINLLSELKPTIGLLEDTAQAKGINFIYNICPADVIYGDKYMLDTVIRNLVSNAIKFTKANGNITLDVFKTEDSCSISVTDDGVGMSTDKLKDLFRMEATKSITTKGTENEKGTGLGLMLCKEMIELHGGNIWAKSMVGRGTVFTVSIPNGEAEVAFSI